MARISGVDLPAEKRVIIGLTYIYGIGRTLSNEILKKAQISPDIRIKNLSVEEVNKLREIIEKGYKIEGELRLSLNADIKRLVEINCYRGTRHKKGLPSRGQRTKTNARTKKGPRKKLGGKVKEKKKA
ncbi:MAG: 30S ribosomal protein S13 [bacterium]